MLHRIKCLKLGVSPTATSGGEEELKTNSVCRMHKPEERQSKAGCGLLKAPLLKILVKYYAYEFAKIK
jgi:hypothetical protein